MKKKNKRLHTETINQVLYRVIERPHGAVQIWMDLPPGQSSGFPECAYSGDLSGSRRYWKEFIQPLKQPKLTDGQTVEDWEEDEGCPLHGEKHQVKKSYDFGLQDAEIFVFKGCQCAVCIEKDPCGILTYPARFHKSYNAATGHACLAKMMHQDKYGN